MFLAGDVGGTKTLVALVEKDPEKSAAGTGVSPLRTVRRQIYKSGDYASLESILLEFLAAGGTPGGIEGICVGVAGPIHEGKCRTTNLPWSIDERALAQVVGCKRESAKLLNDVEASAYGMLFLGPEELVDLNPAYRDFGHGNIAVVAAGTGLGESILYWDGKRHHPLASEGGHCSFAPQSELEVDLWRFLRARFNGHVSYERILSGQGFSDLFDFLVQTGKYLQSQALRAELEKTGDTGQRNAVITRFGLEQADSLCQATLNLFLTIYGAEAGNMALKCVARGGVYLAGGIAPKMRQAFASGAFLEGFMAKGRFANMLSGTRIRLALNQEAGLIGAGNYALDHQAN